MFLRLFALVPLSIVGILCCARASETPIAERLPYTVADSIRFNQLIEPNVAFSESRPLQFTFSPDGQRVAMVSRKGNLVTGVNEYELWILTQEEILRAINSTNPKKVPPRHTLASLAIAEPRHAIEQATWVDDGRGIAFIGRTEDDRAQVYVVDIRTGERRQLTDQQSDIATFSLSWRAQRLLYSAHKKEDWTERDRHGYTVHAEFAHELSSKSPVTREFEYFYRDLDTKETRRLDLPLAVAPQRFHISPSGRFAAILTQVDKLPSEWRNYEFIRKTRGAVAVTSSGDDDDLDGTFGHQTPWIQQFYLIDLENVRTQPLIDAPSIAVSGLTTAIWGKNDDAVILTGTYVPLINASQVDARERERRRLNQAVVEVNPGTRQFNRVAELPEKTPDGKYPLLLIGADQLPDSRLRIRQREYGSGKDVVRYFRKAQGTWTEVRNSGALRSEPRDRVKLIVKQDMNTAPDVFAVDTRTGSQGRVTDLNPWLSQVALGTVKEFQWRDRLGRSYTGGLVLPPDYAPAQQYPIVLQTYGFRAHEFLLDGPSGLTTAFAARAIANQGILVLQLPQLTNAPPNHDTTGKQGQSDHDLGENDLFAIGVEDVIAALDAQRLIDVKKVGIVGFSRSGMHVFNALTFSSAKFAAALISDCVTATPMAYVLAHGLPYPGMLEWEEGGIIGAPLWGKGVDVWVRRSPLYHLDKVTTPLRMEAIGHAVPSLWESYVILKRSGRPVELVHYPGDTHRLQTPYARYTSLQGTVDWFRFWLKGEEDSADEKLEQYKHWRSLKVRYDNMRLAPNETSTLSSDVDP